LARAGYWNGRIEEIMNARIDHVLSVLEYEIFIDDYERVYTELNKPKK
jgi:hypothetical protein